MRADRLVATLLVLQARGRVTAAEVADELEVSVRTARRDLEALAMSGVPVYSQAGRGGGWSLVGGARTDLSGLTATEARTLFLVAGPSAAVTPEAKTALRKLVQALPETFRAEAEAAASAIVLDPASWGYTSTPPPRHLATLQQAVVDGVQVEIEYVARDRAESTRVVHPLGLASKGSTWYLVAGTEAGTRTFRVNRIRSVEVTDRSVERPAGFDLAETWREVVAEMDARRAPFAAQAIVEPSAVGWLKGHLGKSAVVGERTADGRIEVEVRGGSARSLASDLAGYGSLVEVVSPEELRAELAALGTQLVERYSA